MNELIKRMFTTGNRRKPVYKGEVILTKLYTDGETYQYVLNELGKRSYEVTEDKGWVTVVRYSDAGMTVFIRCKRGCSKHKIALSMGYTET